MRTSVSFMISVLMIFCLSLLVCGCGTGPHPQPQGSCCGLWPTRKVQGYESALKYRAGDLPAYRIVITLNPLSEHERNEFLQGFRTAYDDAHDSQEGKVYSTILRQSLDGGFYAEAIVQGSRYFRGETTDVRVQELISGSVGLSRSSGLAWKAGYIVGFAREMSKQRAGFEERFYRQGETKYNALRGPLGV